MRSRWMWVYVLVATIVIAIVAYPGLPDQVPIHFDWEGNPDDYAPKLWASLLTPGIVSVLGVLMQVLPDIDPRGDNYEKFEDTYRIIFNILILFFAGLQVIILGYALGWDINIVRYLRGTIGLLFMAVGNYLSRVRPNWFLGIRTPWTLSSDQVWRKTHRTAAWLFAGGGLVILVTAFIPIGDFKTLVFGLIVLVAVVPLVQSYILWKKEQQ